VLDGLVFRARGVIVVIGRGPGRRLYSGFCL
jgi:hypothetical protein